MKKDHPTWGPKLSQYMYIFDDRLADSFDKYVEKKETTAEATNDMIPLPLLETTLAVGENMHKVGFQSGGKLFPVLMSAVRGYTKLHRGTIFDYYYGFLCIRHLIRMVCIGTMTENESFDDFLEHMHPDMTSHEVTDLLVSDALNIMTEALSTRDLMNVACLLGCVSMHRHAFVIDGGLSYDDVELLVDVLWKGRKAIIALRMCGLLPGLPALLFVLCEMTIFSTKPNGEKPWLHIQDLMLRCYLGDTTDPERNTIRQLCRFTHTQILKLEIYYDYSPVDEDDARTVIQSYIELLSPPLELSLAPIMLLDISSFLFRFVYYLMTDEDPKRAILEELAPDVVKAGLQRLGLEIDREWDGEMQAPRRGFTRNYAGDVFQHISFFAEKIVLQKNRLAFGQMLLDMELYDLAGRVLLFITRETDDEPESWDFFLGSLEELREGLRELPALSQAQKSYIALIWRKIFAHLSYHLQSSLPSQTPKHCIQEGMEAWTSIRPSSISRERQCSYPRCAVYSVYTQHEDARISCARCGRAWYCSSRCQHMHWTLNTSDSHVHWCLPL